MIQKIASLINETLTAMNAHHHVRMTDEEWAYLDAHFEFIHIKKGEHLITRGEEVCYLYYLESGIVRLWFPNKENREISARFIQAKEFINFFLSHEEHYAHYNVKALEECKVWRLSKKDLHQLYELSINFNKLARMHLEKSINCKIKREEDFHTLDAEARYKTLLANEKWLLRSIPLKDIASYIGITPQALSNIRKRI
ncbi:Crp/Fnr family transcriptional regulator [Parabacteroides massiliensis]|uniref:Crp/Fnr family transcriptional regulator n=1 Tax=Parabacteroides massiliensis TaxID=1750560 RepID=UPI00096A8087|nr:Crp/Fnr family transcriptional regulator [Parabacteroides massiliensis]